MKMKITLSLWWIYIKSTMCSLFKVILFEFIFKIYFSLFQIVMWGSLPLELLFQTTLKFFFFFNQ